jgi:hypothetical protein
MYLMSFAVIGSNTANLHGFKSQTFLMYQIMTYNQTVAHCIGDKQRNAVVLLRNGLHQFFNQIYL